MSDISLPQNERFYRLTLTAPEAPTPVYKNRVPEEYVYNEIKKAQKKGFEVKVELIDITVRVVECHEELRAVKEGRA